MPENASTCLVCGNEQRDWISKRGRQIRRCVACGLLVVPAGVAKGPSGVSIYEEDVPIFAAEGNIDYYLDEGQFENFRAKLAWVRQYLPPGASILDAGANYGHFLKVARPDYEAVGFDISPAAVAHSRAHLGVDNVVGSVYALPSDRAGPFDCIVNFDVIEHVDDPRKALETLRAALKPGGLLFVSSPDAQSLTARLLGPRWHYLDPIQHIVVFGRDNLRTLLEQTGFEVLGIRTLGHRYRMSYVLDRLCYLNRDSFLDLPLRAIRWLLRPFGRIPVSLNLGDVMGIVARRRPDVAPA